MVLDGKNENSPSATANDGSKRGGKKDPAVTATSVRNRKPSYTMQKKKEEEIEQIEKLAETVGEKVDEMLVDIRVDNETHLNEDQIIVQDEAERMVKATNKVEKMYERYQQLWREFCEFHEVEDELNDEMLKRFFTELKKKYAASTLWVIYSCVNAHFVEKYGIKLNTMPRLTKYLKLITSHHVTKKSKVFNKDAIHRVLMFAQESGNPEDTLMGIGVSLMYYGLLRMIDVLNVTIDDVKVVRGERVNVNFEHERKRKNPGFAFYIPLIYSPMFERYKSQLNPYAKKSSRFLKNYNERTKIRNQNAGRNAVTRWITRICQILGVPKEGYTTHAFRRSAATNLADSGVSFVNLKRHGQWASDSVVEGYIANSVPLRLEREEKLLPEEVYNEVVHRRSWKEKSIEETFIAPSNRTSPPHTPELTSEERQMILKNMPQIKEYIKMRKEYEMAQYEQGKKQEYQERKRLTLKYASPDNSEDEDLPGSSSSSEEDVPIAFLKRKKQKRYQKKTKKNNNLTQQEQIQEEFESMMEQQANKSGVDVTSDSERSTKSRDDAASFWKDMTQAKTVIYKCNFSFKDTKE